jgi:3-deoxy-D-manno-octulosonic-acid transferase
MTILLFWVYNLIFFPLFFASVHILRPFNRKIALGLKGRKSLFKHLKSQLSVLNPENVRIWVHISSMGEFEQAKPVLELLKSSHPDWYIIISFFSPSGYLNAKSYPYADIKTYLPWDSYFHAKRFIRLLCPSLAVVVRHDIWPNHQWQCQKSGIPSILIDASVSDKRYLLFKRLAFFFKPMVATFSNICTVSDVNTQKLKNLFQAQTLIFTCGDTRYDQVYKRTREKGKIDHILSKNHFSPEKCLVAGSTWPSDEKVLLPAASRMLTKDPESKFIIAPHEIKPDHLQEIVAYFEELGMSVQFFSKLKDSNFWKFRILLIDRIGYLANIYALGGVVFVGGSFGPGIHNVLEPAAHGCAVIFGPRYKNSPEAKSLLNEKAARWVQDEDAISNILHLFQDNYAAIQHQGQVAKKWVEQNLGASHCIVQTIEKYLDKNNRCKHG